VWLLVPLISVFLIRAAHTYFVTSVSIATRCMTRTARSCQIACTAGHIQQRGDVALNLSSAAAQILMSDDYDQIFFSVPMILASFWPAMLHLFSLCLLSGFLITVIFQQRYSGKSRPG